MSSKQNLKAEYTGENVREEKQTPEIFLILCCEINNI